MSITNETELTEAHVRISHLELILNGFKEQFKDNLAAQAAMSAGHRLELQDLQKKVTTYLKSKAPPASEPEKSIHAEPGDTE